MRRLAHPATMAGAAIALGLGFALESHNWNALPAWVTTSLTVAGGLALLVGIVVGRPER